MRKETFRFRYCYSIEEDNRLQHGLAPSSIRIPQITAFNSEDSFIFQALKHVMEEEVCRAWEESKFLSWEQ